MNENEPAIRINIIDSGGQRGLSRSELWFVE